MRMLLPLFAVCFACMFSATAFAQRGPQTQTLNTKLKELQQKGRSTTLVVIDDEGKELEFPLTPRTEFEITASGDEGFVRPGAFLSATGVLTNQVIFIKSLNVHLPDKGQRVPPGKVAKAARQAGQSMNAYDVSGSIVGKEESSDYPGYQVLSLRVAGQAPPIMLEKDPKVTVVSTDTELLKDKEGVPVELEVTPLRGDRWNLVKATIKLSEKMDSAKYFGDAPEAN